MKNAFLLLSVLFLIVACKPKGEKADVSKAGDVKTAAAANTVYNVDLANSKVIWEGSKPGGKHTGTIDISNATLSAKDGMLDSGSFTLDMNSIQVTDLEAGKGKEDLEAHLKGSVAGKENDFFNVAQFPSAKFEITKVSSLMNNPEANTLVYGNLTLRDKTQQVAFKAKVDMADGKVSVTTPPFTINRTQWGINFMSNSVFDNLKDKFINDEISLQIALRASGDSM